MAKQPRKPQLNNHGPWKQGIYDVSNSIKFIFPESKEHPIYRSSYEWLFMKWCEITDDVQKWSSEPFCIPYADPTVSRHKIRNYWIDFTVIVSNGQKWFVEVKPDKQVQDVNKFKRIYESYRTSPQRIAFAKEHSTTAINYSKWMHAIEAAKKQNAVFKIVTEKTLKRI